MTSWLDGTKEATRSGELPTTTSLIDAFYLSGTPTTVTGQTWVPLTTARGTASLTLSGSGAATTSSPATASLSLTGQLVGAAPDSGTGSLTLSASGAAQGAPSGTASLSLSASGTGDSQAPASAFLDLSATGLTSSPLSATAALDLSATGAMGIGVTATASLDLSASGDLSGLRAVDGTASLELSGIALVTLAGSGSASLGLSASGDAAASSSATASLGLSATGAAVSTSVGTASLTFGATGATAIARTGTASLSLSGLATVTRSGAASLSVFARPVTLGIVTVQGAGQIVLESEAFTSPSEMQLFILDPAMDRAPGVVTVVLSGAVAQTDVTFDIDGTDVYTVSADSDGELGPTSLTVSETLGTLGTHTITATQGSITASVTFEVLRAPGPYPAVPGPDGSPAEAPGAEATENGITVRHWVLQDLLPEVDGGIGSYIFPHNPRTMTSPHFEHALTVRRSTASDGKNHIFQAGNLPKEWTFTGYCPTEDHQTSIMAYRNLNRRFYVIDHRNRAWKVVFTNAEFVPRLRQNYNGEETDWGSDFTITATVLDQDYEVLT